MALVSGRLNLPVLETCINFQPDAKFQRMSVALPDRVISDIIKIQNCQTKDEEKQRYIEDKFNEKHQCGGYFFNYDNELSFRHLYLETCSDGLDTFIRKHTKENDFQWTVLQEMCYQLVDSVAWLHQGKIYYDGRLNPRNIFVKRSEGDKWKVQLKIPEKLNPFNNLDELYTQLWSSIKKPDLGKTTEEKCNEIIQRDLISVIILLYFIQSAGNHPFQRGGSNFLEAAERDNYQAINNQIQEETFQLEALNKTCFCTVETGCEEKMACKYRLWINSLAQKHTKTMLTELFHQVQTKIKQYTNQSVEKLKDHPFFWKTADVLTFIERSSSYVHEGGNEAIKRKFGVRLSLSDQKIFSELQGNGGKGNDYKDIVEYLREKKDRKTGKFNSMKTIPSFGLLIKQIRNKSCHWNEETECGKKAKEVLKNIRFVTFKKMNDGKTNFCLFWLIHFPTLLLYTWEQLKDEVR